MGTPQQALLAGSGAITGGLLDAYQTSLWAAWGIKRLVGASVYSGSAIRVRRSSDDAEMDVGFSGQALDSASMVAWGGASSVFVKTLYDQTGNSRDATQATSSLQPRIVNAGVYDAKMVFDGTDDYLATTGGLTTSGATAFMTRVYRRTSTSEVPMGQFSSVVGGDNGWFMNTTAANKVELYELQGTSYESNRSPLLPPAAGLLCMAMRFDLTQSTTNTRIRYWEGGVGERVDISGSVLVGSISSHNFTSIPVGIGATGAGTVPTALDFYQAAYYSAALSPTDILAINSILAT